MGRWKKTSGVYSILCSFNSKRYIGSSVHVKKRWCSHKAALNLNKHSNTLLQEDWSRYGKDAFSLELIEQLSEELTQRDREEREKYWIIYHNTHKSQYGYNKCLPGSIPLKGEDENKTVLSIGNSIHVTYCIEVSTGNILKFDRSNKASAHTGVTIKYIDDCFLYWGDNPKNSRKSRGGWIFIREKDYKEGFDYINYRRPPIIINKRKRKPKDQLTGHHKKDPEDIIPYDQRNVKRVPVMAVKIDTGEELLIPTLSHAPKYGFNLTKVVKCIKHDYGRYKHKGYYFKRAS